MDEDFSNLFQPYAVGTYSDGDDTITVGFYTDGDVIIETDGAPILEPEAVVQLLESLQEHVNNFIKGEPTNE